MLPEIMMTNENEAAPVQTVSVWSARHVASNTFEQCEGSSVFRGFPKRGQAGKPDSAILAHGMLAPSVRTCLFATCPDTQTCKQISISTHKLTPCLFPTIQATNAMVRNLLAAESPQPPQNLYAPETCCQMHCMDLYPCFLERGICCLPHICQLWLGRADCLQYLGDIL